MTWLSILYLALTFGAAAVTLFLAAYAWRRRGTAGVTAFACMVRALAAWLVTSGMERLSTPETYQFWHFLSFLGVAATPVFFLIFILQTNGFERWLSRGWIAALFVVPVLTQAIETALGKYDFEAALGILEQLDLKAA